MAVLRRLDVGLGVLRDEVVDLLLPLQLVLVRGVAHHGADAHYAAGAVERVGLASHHVKVGVALALAHRERGGRGGHGRRRLAAGEGVNIESAKGRKSLQ